MTKKVKANEKMYTSLEQWKNDFLPQTVESEHMQLKSTSDEHGNTVAMKSVKPKEAVNLIALSI